MFLQNLTNTTARHVPNHAVQMSYPALERPDPNLLSKKKDALLVYPQATLYNEAVFNGASQPIVITVPVGEKPGVRAHFFIPTPACGKSAQPAEAR